MLKRRDLLKYAAGSVAAAATLDAPFVLAQGAAAPLAGPAAEPTPAQFDPASVVDLARALSKKPYKGPNGALPDSFSNLSPDAYAGIRSKPENKIWATENTGFVLEPLHRGSVFAAPMGVSIIENGFERRLAYSPDLFDLGKITPPANVNSAYWDWFNKSP